MTIANTWQGDDLVIAVTVLDDDGAAKNLTGGTVEAGASGPSGSLVTPTVTVTDASAGAVSMQFNDGALSGGTWTVQMRVTLDDVTQTVYEDTVKVRRSVIA
jgi:hypothetical protein